MLFFFCQVPLVFKICLFCMFVFLLVFNFLIRTLLPILSFELPDVTLEQPLNCLLFVCCLFVICLLFVFNFSIRTSLPFLSFELPDVTSEQPPNHPWPLTFPIV